MQNPICISTGCVYKFSEDRNILIDILRPLAPAGIELSFSHPQEHLLNFRISEANLEYLRGLEFNSIHAPWREIAYGQNQTSESVLEKIVELYKQINARNIVFHQEQIEDYNSIASLLKAGCAVSLENDDWRKPEHSVQNVRLALERDKGFGFVLDFAHALSFSPEEVREYMDQFSSRLSEIHISIINKELETHDFLHLSDNAEIRELLQPLNSVATPMVLEAVVPAPEEIALLKKEMEYLREL